MAKVFFDGRIMDAEEASLPLLDRGVLFGEGAFETLRSYDYKYFRLDEHIARLYRNLDLLHIPIRITADGIKEALRNTVRADNEKQANVKFVATAGIEGGESRFFIYTKKLTPFPAVYYSQGARLITSELRRNEKNITTTIKSLSYLDSVWARQEALRKGGDEGFFLNSEGHVSEGASSNIFAVLSGRIVTPSLDQGVLPGVTRSFVIELARSMGLIVEEGVLAYPDFLKADEVFITASIKEVMPIASVDGKPVGKSRRITDMLHDEYKRRLPELCRE